LDRGGDFNTRGRRRATTMHCVGRNKEVNFSIDLFKKNLNTF